MRIIATVAALVVTAGFGMVQHWQEVHEYAVLNAWRRFCG